MPTFCSICQRECPVELLSPLITSAGDKPDVCGPCALLLSNQLHGDNRTAFDGPVAESMRLEALAYYKKTNQ